VIDLGDATVELGRARVLRGVTLTCRAGELLALVGPNGAGKSTALAVMAGALPPAAGTARFDGRPLAQWRPEELARRRAVMTQAESLGFAFRVDDVVRLGRHPHPAGRDDADIVRRAAQRVRVDRLLARSFPTLSGGERQRVRLARTLTQIWDVAGGALLLDEPTASLDPAEQHACMATARDEARRGRAVVVVLHDLPLAARYADRIAVLREGRLLGSGTPDDVVRRGLLRDAFGVDVRWVDAGDATPVLLVEPRRSGAG